MTNRGAKFAFTCLITVALGLNVASAQTRGTQPNPRPGDASEVTAASLSGQSARLDSGELTHAKLPSAGEHSRVQGLANQARSAVVMDFSTGKVLFEKDPDEKLPMASITKVMTMLLIMEAVDAGKLRLEDKIQTSEYASSMGGSQIFLEPGESMSVEDLLKGIAIASANDACVSLAEYLSGSEEAFVHRMNERARQLGMEDTHFVNCNGLPASGHYSSAKDIAIMSRELLKHPEITRWTSVYSDYLRKDTDHPLWLVNTNKLVRFYEGVDGLKTGYTSEAKYCLAATAKKAGFRVIVVVMGEPTTKTRNAEVSQLLRWTFANYRSTILYREGQVIGNAPVAHGVPREVQVKVADNVGVIHGANVREQYTTRQNLLHLHAPVRKGQRVGTIQVYQDEDLVAEAPLVSVSAVHKATFMQDIALTLKGLVTFQG